MDELSNLSDDGNWSDPDDWREERDCSDSEIQNAENPDQIAIQKYIVYVVHQLE